MENGAEKKVIVTNMMNQDMVEKKWDYIFTEKEARKHFCVGVLMATISLYITSEMVYNLLFTITLH
jgi:hypothetical protein